MYNDKSLSLAPQVGDGEVTRYYLIGKKANKYKILEVYWERFLNDLGVWTMKKMVLGTVVIIFAICIEISAAGHLEYITWCIGAIGLVISVVGYAENGKGDKQ